jgi:Ras-related GTP-binding protein C/D
MDCSNELIDEATRRLIDTVCAAYYVNPELCVEVFIHKVDVLNEEQQSDLLNSTRRTVEDAVKQQVKFQRQLRLNFNLTSIYDHSVFQAFSLVVQKLIRNQQPYVLELLSMLNSNSSLDLSYLFLSRSKIFIAVDERNRQGTRTYDLCSDAIDMMVRIDSVYSSKKQAVAAADGGAGPTTTSSSSPSSASPVLGTSTIHLSSDDVMYIRELPNELTLVMMLRDENFHNKALIDYNVSVFSNAVAEIFQAGGGGGGK